MKSLVLLKQGCGIVGPLLSWVSVYILSKKANRVPLAGSDLDVSGRDVVNTFIVKLLFSMSYVVKKYMCLFEWLGS